jgi:hypothetical protein
MSHADVAKLLARTSVRKATPAPAVAPPSTRRRRSLPQSMSLTEAVAIAGSLGEPSKMPGPSYGLDANRCHRGSVMSLVPGSICAGCFAKSDFYASWRPVKYARERRHTGIEHPRWVDAMVRLISHHATEVGVFRWHDSGDLQSVEHMGRIVDVCERTPLILHWLPTREYEIVLEHRRARGPFPANLCVRLSALMIDSEPPRQLPGVPLKPGEIVIPDELADLPTSTVHTPGAPLPVEGKGSIACRAVELRGNKCGPCRACWDNRVRNVSYAQH